MLLAGLRPGPSSAGAGSDREPLVATHLPFPFVGHVAADGDTFRWVPTFWDY
jgi:hypothetical protein